MAHPSHQRVEARAGSRVFSEHWGMLMDHTWGETHPAEPTETQEKTKAPRGAAAYPGLQSPPRQSPSEPSL